METTPVGAALVPLALRGIRTYATLLLDPEGSIVGWNPGAERLLGYAAREVLGRSFMILYLPHDLASDKPGHELREAEAAGCSSDDNWLVRKDGSPLFASGLTEPLRDEAGTLAGYVKMFRDVSDRRRVEEALHARADELADSDRQKDRFLAMLSHELRNPIAPLRHAVETLARHHADADDEAARALAVIARQTRQLGRLVDDLLEVTRIATGRIALRRERVDLIGIANAAAAQAEQALAQRGLAFRRHVADSSLYVEGDAERLEQVVAKLLDNAAKFTDAGGTITLAVEHADGGVATLAVRDTGIGIDPAVIGRVFEPFVQDDRHLERAQGGLGLGLALAQRLATLHGGALHARSAGPGCGSEFVLELPLLDPTPGPVSAEVRPTVDCVAPEAIVVLVVDDNVDGADSIAMLLGMRGHPVHVAYNGPQALELAARVHPDLMLLDIGLPAMDGYEVARRLRAGSPRCVLAAMTGYGAPADRERAFAEGFDFHLLKPVEPDELEAMLVDTGRRLARR